MNDVKYVVAATVPLNNRQNPCIIVISALSRYGTGAAGLWRQVGVPETDILIQNKVETACGGSSEETAAVHTSEN